MRFRRHQEAVERATWRMLAAFALALLLLVVAADEALALVVRLLLPFMHGVPPLFFETNTAVVLLFVLGGCWIETLRLREGGPHVARLAGARPADPAGRLAGAALERRLVNVVQEITSLITAQRADHAVLFRRERRYLCANLIEQRLAAHGLPFGQAQQIVTFRIGHQ